MTQNKEIKKGESWRKGYQQGRNEVITKLQEMIKDMKDKQYEATTILDTIENNLEFNKFEED